MTMKTSSETPNNPHYCLYFLEDVEQEEFLSSISKVIISQVNTFTVQISS